MRTRQQLINDLRVEKTNVVSRMGRNSPLASLLSEVLEFLNEFADEPGHESSAADRGNGEPLAISENGHPGSKKSSGTSRVRSGA